MVTQNERKKKKKKREKRTKKSVKHKVSYLTDNKKHFSYGETRIIRAKLRRKKKTQRRKS